jgi:hypothetical protein
MTSNDDLDRRLTARLDERAAPRAPQGLSEAATEGIEHTRQLPAWATTERWISMETRAQLGAIPRAIIVLATLALLTALAASAIVVGANNTPKLPTPFGAAGNGLIAFVSDGDIYVVDPGSSDLQQITSGPETSHSPSWSRDGTMLAYWSGQEDAPGTLYVTDAEGAVPIAVAESAGTEYGSHEWSEDSTEIIYEDHVPGLGTDPCPVTEGGACGSRLFIANVDGSGSRPVGDPDLDARGPALSPDGSTIAFGGGEAASEALYLMDWDGSEVRRLETGIPGSTWAFAKQAWSADGNEIVTHDGSSRQQVWTVRFDADGEPEPAQSLGFGLWPTYSADGSGIIWATSFGASLWTTGDDPGSVTINGANERAWSPDGTQFVAIRDDQLEIIDRDGDTIKVLAPSRTARNPAWQRVAL